MSMMFNELTKEISGEVFMKSQVVVFIMITFLFSLKTCSVTLRMTHTHSLETENFMQLMSQTSLLRDRCKIFNFNIFL